MLSKNNFIFRRPVKLTTIIYYKPSKLKSAHFFLSITNEINKNKNFIKANKGENKLVHLKKIKGFNDNSNYINIKLSTLSFYDKEKLNKFSSFSFVKNIRKNFSSNNTEKSSTSLSTKNTTDDNKTLSFSELKPNNSEIEMSFSLELKKIKTFVEVLLSKDGEKDLDILDLKKYFFLNLKTQDIIEKNITDSKEIKDKLIKIIQINKSLKKNQELVKYLLYQTEHETNDYIFKSLLINSLIIINSATEDTEIERYYYLKDLRYNLISINPRIFLRSKFLLQNLHSLLEKLVVKKNYLAADTIDLVVLSNFLHGVNIDITNEEFFNNTAFQVFNKEVDLHFDMLFTIDNIEAKPEFIENMFQFFMFYENYNRKFSNYNKASQENEISIINTQDLNTDIGRTNSFIMSFAQKIAIKKKFLEFFKKLYLKIILNQTKHSQSNSYSSKIGIKKAQSNDEKINLEHEIIIKDKSKIYSIANIY